MAKDKVGVAPLLETGAAGRVRSLAPRALQHWLECGLSKSEVERPYTYCSLFKQHYPLLLSDPLPKFLPPLGDTARITLTWG